MELNPKGEVFRADSPVSFSDLLAPPDNNPPSFRTLNLLTKTKVIVGTTVGVATVAAGVTLGKFIATVGLAGGLGLCGAGALLVGCSYGIYRFELSKAQILSAQQDEQHHQDEPSRTPPPPAGTTSADATSATQDGKIPEPELAALAPPTILTQVRRLDEYDSENENDGIDGSCARA